MTRYCLDTSAYLGHWRGDRATTEKIDAAGWIGVPTIVLGELHMGCALTGGRPEDLARTRDFLAHPLVDVVSVDDTVARAYGQLMADLRRAGTPLPANDVWIAACAARTSSVVLTCDAHFTRIARIGCELLRRVGTARRLGRETGDA